MATPPRRFTVKDSIEFSTFLSPTGAYGETSPQASFSPDKSLFVVVTMRGDLNTGKREARMWLFESSAARTYLSAGSPGDLAAPRLLAKFASAANREPISQWRWSRDSRSVLFLVADDDGAERLYRVSIETGAVSALSRPEQDVSKFDERNGQVVYLAHEPVRANDLYQAAGSTLPDIIDGTGQSLLPLLFPHWIDTIFRRSDDELWQVEESKAIAVTDNAAQVVHLRNSRLVLSPDGRYLLVTSFVKHIPKLWEQYRPLEDYPGLRITADTPETEGSTGHYRPQQYALVDLSNGKQSLLVNAPIELLAGYSDLQAEWSEDGSRIALPMVYPPLDSSPGAAQNPYSVLPCTIMVIDLRAEKRSCVQTAQPIDVQKTKYGDRPQMISLRWENSGRELVAEYASPNAPDKKSATRFIQSGDKWTARDQDVSPRQGELSVAVKEAIDEPPVLGAQIGSGNPRRIFDPNPQLKQIALGTAVLYTWRDSEGDEWTGALVKPPDFSAARRYPLVIQTHGLDRSKYLVDGPSATGFAARVFAGHDIVVLQVDEINKNTGTGKEAETGAAGYRAAIQQLVREGVVDPERVGIISWSHFGPQVFQGLIDDAHTYAAATIAESTYDSYGEYLMNIDYMGKEREQMFRALYGAKPFGPGLKNWVEGSPGFHSDRFCAPLLFQFNSPASLVYGWDMYAALRAQDKPVDLFYIRNGDHVLVKPLERLAEQEMNVDWYDYWLNGRKDNDPAKADQYKRWDLLKTLPRCSEPAATR